MELMEDRSNEHHSLEKKKIFALSDQPGVRLK